MVAIVGSSARTVIGQNSTAVVVTGGMLITVVFVWYVSPEDERTEVVNGGHESVSVDSSWKGGRTKMQGGWHCATGPDPLQIEGSR